MADELPLVRLPSRWEDLDESFRGRLRPNKELIEEVQRAYRGMQISGGIRFLPILGESGSGKTSAARELGTHLDGAAVFPLSRESVEDIETLKVEIQKKITGSKGKDLLIPIVDQYEEAAAQKQAIPTSFVEALALLDRGELRNSRILFIWLTTSREFQQQLARATTRNTRILQRSDFELKGPPRDEWPGIIEDTFRFHNKERSLADFEIIESDLREVADDDALTLGAAIERIGRRLENYARSLHDLSNYQVVMLWPVTDGLRITRIQQFTDPRQEYKLDWNSWFRQLNTEDQRQLPLREYNRTRLYFDFRLVPIAAADLHRLCRGLESDNVRLYALVLRKIGFEANYEATIQSEHGKVRTDVLVKRAFSPTGVCLELKAFSAENTMPSTICSQVQSTLRKYAQFVGFVSRQ